MSEATVTRYAFEGYVLEPLRRELRGPDDRLIALSGRAYDTLVYLVEHRERVVGKDELLATVWAGRVVEDNNLTQAISTIRRAFGGGAGDHRFLLTIPGHGYRFVAQVASGETERDKATRTDTTDAEGKAAPEVAPDAAASASPRRRRMDAWRRPLLLVLLLSAIGALLLWRQRDATPVAAAAEPALATSASLAVLPFRSLSPGTRDDLLGLGLADTLITRIGSSTTLQVRSLASSQRFLGNPGDSLAAAKALGAEYVLEGTTQRSGDQVRVGVRLLDAEDGRMLWSGSFDERIDRVFTLQDRVANDLTRALLVKFAAVHGSSPCDGANADAYRAYLSGLYQINRPTGGRLLEALQDFRRAIELDPSCARAYAGMAFAHRALVMTADHVPGEEFPLAKAAVAKALTINPELAEAYASKGFIEFWYDWDWEASEASFKRAIALNPSLAEAHFGYAHLLANIGRMPQAVQEARQAIALDPLSPLISTISSFFIAASGAREEAARIQDGVAERDPDYWTVWMNQGQRLQARGEMAAAEADLQRAVRGCNDCAQALMILGLHYAKAGDRASAESVLRQLEEKRRESYAPATALAAVRNALGGKDVALDLLEQGYAERDVRMSFLGRDPFWANLRGEPRFRALMRKLRLQERPPQKS